MKDEGLENQKDHFPAKFELLCTNARVATMAPNSPYGLVTNGALGVSAGKIAWIGRAVDLPEGMKISADKIIDAQGCLITPGLIDCHTHLIYAGSRANEFEMRLKGVSYEEIARRGGGILSTVFATREADDDELLRQSAPRLRAMMNQGVTTIEIKSGYGLDLDTEVRILRVASRLGTEYPVTVVPTYLGAHAIPPEYQGRSDEYVNFICSKVLPHIAHGNLAVFVDVFCEKIAFSRQQTERIFKVAKEHGLGIKLHAEQLSDQGGAELASQYGAVSVDHLEYLTQRGVKSLAGKGTVAVLLPGAAYFLREKKVPPIDLLRKHGIPMAVSTDCNPGSSPIASILLVMNMACILFGLTPEEALRGTTVNAAKAIGLEHKIGTLEKGKDADFVVWDVKEPVELVYGIGMNNCRYVVKRGEIVLERGNF